MQQQTRKKQHQTLTKVNREQKKNRRKLFLQIKRERERKKNSAKRHADIRQEQKKKSCRHNCIWFGTWMRRCSPSHSSLYLSFSFISLFSNKSTYVFSIVDWLTTTKFTLWACTLSTKCWVNNVEERNLLRSRSRFLSIFHLFMYLSSSFSPCSNLIFLIS